MQHRRAPFVMGAVLVVVALAASTALAARTTPFTGTSAGTVTEKVDGQTVTGVTAGTGTGTLLGKSKLTGSVTGTTAEPPCSPVSGPGVLAGATGKLKINVLPVSRACAASEEDRDNITVSGSAKVTGGTLKFRKARGTLRFVAHYDRKSGAFDVKLTGTLTY